MNKDWTIPFINKDVPAVMIPSMWDWKAEQDMCLLLNQYGGNLSQWFALSHHQTLVINKSVKNNCNTYWMIMLHDYFKLQLNSIFETKFYYWKIIAKFATVHLEPNAVKITYFQYEYHCNHYLPRSGHKNSGHKVQLAQVAKQNKVTPWISSHQKGCFSGVDTFNVEYPRNETPNMEDIFVRVVCIDSPSQCDNGWDRCCGTNSHIPRTYRPRQHPHFAAALHTFINF